MIARTAESYEDKAVEYEMHDGKPYLVLRRPMEDALTEPCPFCNDPHLHGLGDGHRVSHCIGRDVTLTLSDGTVLRQDRGYMVRTGPRQEGEDVKESDVSRREERKDKPLRYFEERRDTHEWVVLGPGFGDGSEFRVEEIPLLEALAMGYELAFLPKDTISLAVATPEPTSPEGFRLRSIADLEKLPAVEWLIEKMIPTRGLSFLIGKSGHGKTFVAVSMALSIATGRDWFGRVVRGSPVVFALGEGLHGLRARVSAWQQLHPEVGEAQIFFSDRVPNLMERNSCIEFVEAVKESGVRPGGVFVDTWSRAVAGADENAAKDMSAAVENADFIGRALGCSVIALHHVGKDATQGSRGSSALQASLEAEWELRKLDDGILELRPTKLRDSDTNQRIYLSLKPVITSVGESAVVTDIAPREMRDALTKGEQTALTALRGMKQPATFSDWLGAAGMARTSFRRVVRGLAEKDLIRQTARGYEVTPE